MASQLNDLSGSRLALVGLAASITLVASSFYVRRAPNGDGDHIIKSPLAGVLEIVSDKQKRLPYPPDSLPGARDVNTPYGSIRVHEWGPETGRKVLLVHGISTPCLALASVAEELAKNGCRVMMFDLFGRGFSDTPDPRRYPQDIKLFTTQILLVLTSSSISWTGSERFSLIGYSLGGAIAGTFTSYFPMVDSLILIAPAGLMRASRIHWTSKIMYGGLLPEPLVSWLVGRRMLGNHSPPSEKKPVEAAGLVEEESAPHPALSRDSAAPLSPRRPSVSVSDAVIWQLHSHVGFLPAFISSIRYAPIRDQHEHWRQISHRIRRQRDQPSPENGRQGLREGRVLVILGKSDAVILTDETSEDAKAVFGEDCVDVKVLDGGHDLPVVSWAAVSQTILEFWKSARESER